MKFRNDILLLRGYSIIIIVLYHCNIIFYGYIAVTVFIVLSGYLYKNTTKSYALFKRYIRLIFPCLTSTWTILVLFANELNEQQLYNFYNEIISTLCLYTNYYFIYYSTDYFNPPEDSLLLHHWYIAVDYHLHFISLLFNYHSKLYLSIVILLSFSNYIFTFYNYKSYNYFSSNPKIWQFLFSKVFIYESNYVKSKCIISILLLSIVFISIESVDIRVINLIIVIATDLFLHNSVNFKFQALEVIGSVSYYIYLVHYPIIKIEGVGINFITETITIVIILFFLYENSIITNIYKHRILYSILLLLQLFSFLYYSNRIFSNEIFSPQKPNTSAIKQLNRHKYCCYTTVNKHDNNSVLFIGDSHIFNLIGNFYNILQSNNYIIYFKYIHTEFIIHNNSNLYDLTDYFHLIINMNLFYDNIHEEYKVYYQNKVIYYLSYLITRSNYVLYFIPTPVLKKRISCKNQKNYVAKNGVDITLFSNDLPNISNVFLFDISHLFCNNRSCVLKYKNSCVYSDEHHFTYNFYKNIYNYTSGLMKPYIENKKKARRRIDSDCEYILYKNKILRAWKFPIKYCKLIFYY